jgi:SWI/SNF-related matrix-associated actin-dependent regulator of chromatin subfamily A-like protein 1
MKTLMPYQQIGATFLANRRDAMLADDPGLGKSAQAIRACDLIQAKSVLIISPASLLENWKREVREFSTSGFTTQIVSYDKARAGKAQLIEQNWDALVVDEAHYLKTAGSARTRCVYGPKTDKCDGLSSRVGATITLTGTPTPNHAAELWTHLRALAPDTIKMSSGKPMPYWTFVHRYCKVRDTGFGLQILGGKNLDELRERIKPFMLRRTKEEVLKDLPPIRFANLYLKGDVTGLSGDDIHAVRMTLLHGGPEGLAKLAPHVATLRRLTGIAKVIPATEWVKEFLLSTPNKIVVFGYSQDVVRGLALFLPGAVVVSGATSLDARQKAVDAFQNDPAVRVFIGQYQAAGTGLTLTAASDVLFVESSWVPAENIQAAMRVHRIGQVNPCLVRFATLAGSIDEDIQEAVARKTADIDALFG